mmetsp:Transcript_58311/g.162536  ORF Transcript_58311/g.162536 Transcript_58311/m.162536 type:complete len:135 (-) Transcript_58311:138-542(-)
MSRTAAVEAMRELLEAQDEELPGILRELAKGHKQGHWIWYVFPTSMAGACDPRGTYVTPLTVKNLFENETRAEKWRQALELMCDHVEKDGMDAVPPIDHGRIHWFLKEWKKLDHGSAWMGAVLARLEKHPWPPR